MQNMVIVSSQNCQFSMLAVGNFAILVLLSAQTECTWIDRYMGREAGRPSSRFIQVECSDF